MILIDTSAWIEFLRDTGSPVCKRVDDLLAGDLACCDPVRMEVLAGARDEHHLGASQLYRQCRRHGETPRKLVDCVIAAVAVHGGAPVLHADADFDALAGTPPSGSSTSPDSAAGGALAG